MQQKQIIYVDLDGVMVDLETHAVERHGPDAIKNLGKLASIDKDLFEDPQPIPGAIEAVKKLTEVYEVYFLTTAPWSNANSWSSKRRWVQKNLGKFAHKKLIISHRKDLCMGEYLIDDRPNNGAAEFKGEWIQFGTEKFPNWEAVLKYLNI